MLQADNGPEFQRWYHDQLKSKGITLRHSRVRQSNDNAHIERFNRTIQDECLSSHPKEQTVQARLTPYLNFYNNERPHLGINFQTPGELLPRR
jgi:transposase InsO family protein